MITTWYCFQLSTKKRKKQKQRRKYREKSRMIGSPSIPNLKFCLTWIVVNVEILLPDVAAPLQWLWHMEWDVHMMHP